jgi:hypothetical protein
MTTLIPKFDLKNGGAVPTGAVNRPIFNKLAETISVKDFGAIGDGIADDTAAIQAALNLNQTVYTPIFFPAGTYKVTSALTFTATGANPNFVQSLSLFGEASTNITNPTVLPNSGSTKIVTTITSGNLFTFTNSTLAGLTNVSISNIQFVGSDTGTTSPNTTGNGLVFATTTSTGHLLRINNVCVSQFGGTGVKLDYVENSLINALTANYCGTGVQLVGPTNANVFNYLEVQECFNVGLLISAGAGNSFVTPLIQGNKRHGLQIIGAEATTFTSPYFENNNTTNTASKYDIYMRGDGVTYFPNSITFTSAEINGVYGGIYLDSTGGNPQAISSISFIACRNRTVANPNTYLVGDTLNGINFYNSAGFNFSDPNALASTEAWQTWTPTVANATAGVGATSIFNYRKQGNALQIYISLVNWTVTGAGTVTFTPPSVINYRCPLSAFDTTYNGEICYANNVTNKITLIKSAGTNWSGGETLTTGIAGQYPTITA